jgi:DNA-directed RNA polymerase alpha subunit
MQRREFSFQFEDTTICFVQLYNDCWICSLPSHSAERLRQRLLGADLSVDELDLSLRLKNFLKSENLATIHDLIQLTENEILKRPNIGRGSLKDLKSALAARGFELRNSSK